MSIDSHQHFWKFHPAQQTWMTADMEVLRRDYLPEELKLAALSAGDLPKTIRLNPASPGRVFEGIGAVSAANPWPGPGRNGALAFITVTGRSDVRTTACVFTESPPGGAMTKRTSASRL